jgi:hypothetical protein
LELEEKWRQLRRGWYVGGKSFGDRLREPIKNAVRGRRRTSHSGGARLLHDTNFAEQAIKAGLKVLDLSEVDFRSLRKGAPEKMALASWLRQRTTASLEWIAGRLSTGHPHNVGQGCRKLNRQGCKQYWRLLKLLEEIDLEDLNT